MYDEQYTDSMERCERPFTTAARQAPRRKKKSSTKPPNYADVIVGATNTKRGIAQPALRHHSIALLCTPSSSHFGPLWLVTKDALKRKSCILTTPPACSVYLLLARLYCLCASTHLLLCVPVHSPPRPPAT